MSTTDHDLPAPGEQVPATKRYVVGFLFDQTRKYVVLIRKNRPEWQAGRLNGVGGKVEPGECEAEAMAREFHEETGYYSGTEDWEHICTIGWPDDAVRVGGAEPTTVAFYRSILPPEDEWFGVTSMTDEQVEIWPIVTVSQITGHVIPNLQWLLPLAAYTADRYEPFTLNATVAEAVEVAASGSYAAPPDGPAS